jgi:Fe-S oxidoreductase
VIKEWWYYFFQCTECRRCSVYCPYGIDTAEITIMARELTEPAGLSTSTGSTPVNNCFHTGNHLGLKPHTFKENIDYLLEDIEEITGVKIDPTFNRKGAELLFITPSGDVFADPGIFTCMGYMMLFEHIGLDYTWSTYASEGGNFGFFTSTR